MIAHDLKFGHDDTVGLDHHFIVADTSKIQRIDKISIPFKKGLLGFNYIPEPKIRQCIILCNPQIFASSILWMQKIILYNCYQI